VTQRIPPPPPGFVIQQPAAAPPPPPPGFVLEGQQPAQERPSAASRAVSAVTGAVRGNASESAGGGLLSDEYLDNLHASPAWKEGSFLDRLGIAIKNANAQLFGGGEADVQRRIQETVGGTETQDAAGNKMVALPDGRRVYLNRPGLDAQDLQTAATQAGAYAPVALAAPAIGAASLPARAAVSGLASAATNVGLQNVAGRESVDPGEVVLTGALGAAGEAAAPMISRVASSLRDFALRGGGRERAALEFARKAGIEQPTNAQIQSLSRALGEIDSGADPAAILQGDEFGFLFTTGQRMSPTDPRRGAQLAREEFLRSPVASPNQGGVISDPANILANVDNQNAKVWEGIIERGTGGLNPSQQFGQVQGALQAQRQAAKEGVGAAYAAVREGGNSFVGLDGLRQMPQRLRAAVRDFRIDPQNFPATSKAIQGIEDDLARLSEGRVSAVSLDAIESQRRVLNNQIGAAANKADRAALTALKREFDNAVDDAWESSLRSGDPAQLEALKNARAARAEFARRFEPDGEAGSLVESLSLGNITPDEAVAKVIGVTQVAPPKAIPYIRAIKAAAKDDPAVIKQLQAAHFANLLQDSAGNTLAPGRIAANIQRAERNTGSLIRELYTPDQWAQMRRLADAASRLSVRGPDANVTGGGRGLRGIQQMMQSSQTLGVLSRVPGVQWALEAVQQGVRAADASAAARGVIQAVPNRAAAPVAAAQGDDLNAALRAR